MGPAHRVMVVGLGPPEVGDALDHELGGLEVGRPVEGDDLVERAVRGPLGAGPVVADDQVDQCVVQHAQLLEGVDEPADVVVGVLHEPGVDLHLAGQHRLEVGGHVAPGLDLGRAGRQLGVGGHHPELFLAGQGLLAQGVPAGVEAALVLVGPLGGHVVGGVGGAGGEVHEELLVGHERPLLADPRDGPVGHVLGEVVALLRRLRWLDRGDPVVQGRVPLVCFRPHEPVEVFETAAGGPLGERPHRAGLPHRHLVALAEGGGGEAVEPQDLGHRRRRVGPHRVIAGGGGGDLGDTAHAHRMVVAARQQRLAGRRAQGGGVKPVESQAAVGQALGVGRVARAAEDARRPEPGVVDHHHHHVGRTGRWPQGLDRRERRLGILGVVGGQAHVLAPRDGQMGPGNVGHGAPLVHLTAISTERPPTTKLDRKIDRIGRLTRNGRYVRLSDVRREGRAMPVGSVRQAGSEVVADCRRLRRHRRPNSAGHR